jgi:glucose-6-phosphate 1-dehydrogenase
LSQDPQRSRIVVEKPLGYDLESARRLNRVLTDSFCESQIFRIDHYLGKEMVDDATLFMRADQVEAAWSLLTPILEVWASTPPSDFPNYAAGTWGPEAAEVLIAQDGRTWLQPAFLRLQR